VEGSLNDVNNEGPREGVMFPAFAPIFEVVRTDATWAWGFA